MWPHQQSNKFTSFIINIVKKMREGYHHARPSSSTSKMSVELGGMVPGMPEKEKEDVEEEGGTREPASTSDDKGGVTLGAVGPVGFDDELRLLALAHFEQRLIPPTDDLTWKMKKTMNMMMNRMEGDRTHADLELERRLLLAHVGVEHLAVLEHARVPIK